MVKEDDPLREYRDKRDFGLTPEPLGAQGEKGDDPIFVIQKHSASRLHYDLRLEIGGVLKSWAVPKGPSTNPKDKRLAVPTEDHPIGYESFEGVIPEGQYGAGTVIAWDIGSYRNLTVKDGEQIPMELAIRHGYAAFRLEGRKLKGSYSLTRFRGGKDESWLLTKKADEYADSTRDILVAEPYSALSGRTVEEIAAEGH